MARKRRKNTRTPAWRAYLNGTAPALKLLWQSLAHTLHRLWVLAKWTARLWWRLPLWAKGMKVLLITAMLVSLPLLDMAREWWHYRGIYDTYYGHFRAEYSKTLTPAESHYYADYYADFYAKYYSSAEYRQSLRYALPSASNETVAFPPDSPVARFGTNAAGLALIKRFEGLELEPYADAGGKLTIGYGHLIKPGEYFTRMSEAQAHALLREDVKVAEAYVKRYVHVGLNENQFAALVSLVYNIGPGNFRKSTLLRQLNQGNGDKAAAEFTRWNKVGNRTLAGLTKRRKAERALFQTPPS